MARRSESRTIFDDIFRTMAQKMPGLLIAVINDAFGTDYPSDVRFEQFRNEHYEKNGTIITDSILRIKDHIYHIECQSDEDSTMAIRMVEYDFSIALERAEKNQKEYVIQFPESCVLYLRHNSKTPDKLKATIHFPDGQEVIYKIPVIKVQNYTADDIFRKKLLFFLPFYLMRYEKERHEIAKDPERLKNLLEECEEIRARLESDTKKETKLYQDLVDFFNRVNEYIMSDEAKVRKEVSKTMGGKVLMLASEKSEKRGEKRGIELGEKRGEIKRTVIDARYYGADKESAIARLIDQFNLTRQEAQNSVETYWG